ncbi:hypothetical protein KR093_005658 [Drosophila rubida]|uniref:DNA topoisomerase 1 n=1 Tax=Drosophila rubida TaxID=30044 RepID=A0AAD4K4Q8_9MUSC|nr:hypothetical protein KR093_005658 [Drosophila rubida]
MELEQEDEQDHEHKDEHEHELEQEQELGQELGQEQEQEQEVQLQVHSVDSHKWASRLRPRTTICYVASSDSVKYKKAIKWFSLRHNGPLFAPTYKRLPPSVRFYYDDEPLQLSELAEEVATLYAKLLHTDDAQTPQFIFNFFSDFRSVLTDEQSERVMDFNLCKFSEIHEYFESRGELNKSRFAAEDEEQIQRHAYCYIDGERRSISHYRLKPLSLCCNSHQGAKGTIIPRVQAEQVSINCDENEPVPEPPVGHSWLQVVHDRTLRWLFCWRDICSGKMIYAYARRQTVNFQLPNKQQLEVARRLALRLNSIRLDYQLMCHSEHWVERQRSIALYCIDRLAMSCGRHLPEEMDTAGVGKLRRKHLKLESSSTCGTNVMHLNLFNGSEEKSFNLENQMFFLLNTILAGKQSQDLIFEELTPELLSDYLETLLDGLTSHIFRICNASLMLEKSLDAVHTLCMADLLQSYHDSLQEVLAFCTFRQPIESRSISLIKSRGRVENISADQMRINAISECMQPLVEASLNYLDPRITIAWCMRSFIPINLVYKSSPLRLKLKWALDITTRDFRF